MIQKSDKGGIFRSIGRGLAKGIFFLVDIIRKRPWVTLILIFMLSLMLFMNKSSNTLKVDLNTCTTTLGSCKQNLSQQLTITAEEKSSLEQQLVQANMSLKGCFSKIDDEKAKVEDSKQETENVKKDVVSCKQVIMQKETELSNKTLEVVKVANEKEILMINYDSIEKNFARAKCCPTYPLYTNNNNDIVCCYQDKTNYICGAGSVTSQNKTKQLLCS